MEYKNIDIYYFSGTGNSAASAKWFAEAAAESCSRFVNIAQTERRGIAQPESGNLIVFTSPIHGFNYPPIMINFLLHFPRGRNHVVLMNTRAGMRIGKFVTPGLTGIAFLMAWLILFLKGYTVRGLLPVDLPSNWVSIHPGLNAPTVDYLFERNKQRVDSFARKVLSGGRSYKALREIVQDLLVSPISFLYYFIGRFLISKTFYASAKCDNCGVCVASCPVRGVIRVGEKPFWTFKCESCMKCMGQCPRNAIETGHGFFIGCMVLSSFIFSLITARLWDVLPSGNLGEFAEFAINSLEAILVAGLMYRAMHYLLRFRWFERLMAYTSLTFYKFWGRKYRAPKY